MKRILLIALCAVSTLTYAQKKELTLETSVMQRWGSLNPERVRGLQWLPGTDKFVEVDHDDVMIFTVGKDKGESFLSFDTFLHSLTMRDSLKPKHIPHLTWANENEAFFSHHGLRYKYNGKTKHSDRMYRIPATASNVHFSSTGQAAFTIDNNVYVSGEHHKEQLTFDKNEDVINGAAVHRFEFGISKGLFWSPSGNKLAFYRMDESMVATYPIIDINTKPASTKMIHYPMAGEKSHHVKLGIYDLKTGKHLFLHTNGDPEHYLTNVQWGKDEKFVYMAEINRDQNHLEFNKYDAVTGDLVKTLFEENDEKFIQPLKAMHFIPGKNNEFLWISDRDGYKQIFHYDTDGKLLGKVTQENWVVKEILGVSTAGEVIYSGTGPNGSETNLYKSTLAGKTTQINKVNGTHHGRFNPVNGLILDQYSSNEIARQTEIIDLKGKVKQVLLTSKNPLDDFNVGETKLVTLKSEDGMDLYGRMILPADFDPKKKYPTMVYVYGGPGVQIVTNSHMGGASPWMYYYANQGNIVFSLDNRGSSNRSAAFEKATFRNLGDKEIEDQLVGVNYLKSLAYVNQEKMSVHGWSYGGFMTTSLMLRSPETFKAGVAGGPVIDWKYYEIMYTERYMDTPQSNREGFAKASLLPRVKDLKGDLLLIHGTVDDVVVWQHSLDFVKAAVDQGVLIDYFVYPGHPHNVRGKDRVHLMRRVFDYIDKSIK